MNGNKEIGYGHVARGILLANYAVSQRGDSITFMTKSTNSFIPELQIIGEVIKVEDFYSESIQQAGLDLCDFQIVLIDLIEEEFNQLSWIKSLRDKLLIVSFTLFFFEMNKRYEHLTFFPSVLPVGHLEKGGIQVFSGPAYFTFREEFLGLDKEVKKEATRLLITMGGTDPLNITYLCLKAVVNLDYFIEVVLSPINSYYEEIKELIKDKSNIHLHNKVSSMAKLMLNSDVVLLNGGLTRYETCMAQTPFIAIAIHETQFKITEELTHAEVGMNLGIVHELSEMQIQQAVIELMENYHYRLQMSRRMRKLFDGKGVERIFELIYKNL
ncbi:hypothetical protein LZF95_11505 [Algoriphagus sp. AGSA1]|uniref:hypothetical protein n=1 Tax=Algoriphagus sp. AGSA1 TaxID=2907213 RepID=UPI001F3AC088|nr:hypothetical protein [Algoriphagus sp. AGSA1]MCE7055303.1 hypothetical protein [Algoriphagus sp. AGSA1]